MRWTISKREPGEKTAVAPKPRGRGGEVCSPAWEGDRRRMRRRRQARRQPAADADRRQKLTLDLAEKRARISSRTKGVAASSGDVSSFGGRRRRARGPGRHCLSPRLLQGDPLRRGKTPQDDARRRTPRAKTARPAGFEALDRPPVCGWATSGAAMQSDATCPSTAVVCRFGRRHVETCSTSIVLKKIPSGSCRRQCRGQNRSSG